MRRKNIDWRINEQIRAPEVRVIDNKGKQVGVFKREEALEKAREAGLDLVEIAPRANPPVVKIVDIGKFRYEQEKKLREQKKKARSGEKKEVRFSPFIADNDYKTRIEKVKEFLEEKNKVKVVAVFKGRHMGSKLFGYKLMERILSDLGEGVAIDMEPKFLGRHLTMVVSPRSTAKRGGGK